jgi:antitoxin component of RelBE/YafQ-DinJ toxin-antitoxin module
MTKNMQINFRITPDVREALDAIKDRDGIPYSEQLRRALQLWITQKLAPVAVRKGTR